MTDSRSTSSQPELLRDGEETSEVVPTRARSDSSDAERSLEASDENDVAPASSRRLGETRRSLSSMPPRGGQVLGRYVLERELARSDWGSLWTGRIDSGADQGQVVAIRRLDAASALDPEAFDRVCEAAWTSLELRHPSILSVRDVVVAERSVAVISDYVDAVPLSALLRACTSRAVQMPTPIALRVALDVLSGLGAAHRLWGELGESAQPFYGGLEPASVLVTKTGNVRLIDIGVAGCVIACGPIEGDPPAYRAPETLESARFVDARADVYGVGVLLWEMLANRRLFPSMLNAPPRVVTAGMPDDIAPIITRALARRADARYANADELAHALRTSTAELPASSHEFVSFLHRVRAEEPVSRRPSVPPPGFDAGVEIIVPKSARVPQLEQVAAAPDPSAADPHDVPTVSMDLTAVAIETMPSGSFEAAPESDPIVLPPPPEPIANEVKASAPAELPKVLADKPKPPKPSKPPKPKTDVVAKVTNVADFAAKAPDVATKATDVSAKAPDIGVNAADVGATSPAAVALAKMTDSIASEGAASSKAALELPPLPFTAKPPERAPTKAEPLVESVAPAVVPSGAPAGQSKRRRIAAVALIAAVAVAGAVWAVTRSSAQGTPAASPASPPAEHAPPPLEHAPPPPVAAPQPTQAAEATPAPPAAVTTGAPAASVTESTAKSPAVETSSPSPSAPKKSHVHAQRTPDGRYRPNTL